MTSDEPISTNDLGQVPLTPTAQKLNVAEAYDLQDRVNNAERELSIARTKLTREIYKNRRLQEQISEYIDALGRAVQDCSIMRHHFQIVSDSHLALSEEFEKAKLMVETLEAVIRMLYISSPGRLGSTNAMASGELPVADEMH